MSATFSNTITVSGPTLTISNNSGTQSYMSVTASNYGLSHSTIGYFSIQPQRVKYIVLDTEIEVDGYKDPTTAIYISMINLMGKPFYDEVKKQGVSFPKEIESFLEKALITWERNKKLDSIFNDKGPVR